MKLKKDSLKGEPCEYCNGTLADVVVTDTFRVGGRRIVVEGVPVGLCTSCGEKCYPGIVLKRVEGISRRLRRGGRVSRVPIFAFSRRKA